MLKWTFQWFAAPKGQTLQERYPAAPGAFVTSYSSIELTDDAFVEHPRCYCDRCIAKRERERPSWD